MTKVAKYLVIALLPVALFVACKQERQICLTPKTAILNVSTVHFTPGVAEPVDSALPNAYFFALTASDLQGVQYERAHAFALSLSPVTDTCLWIMGTDSLDNGLDTLVFYYKRELQFLSNACGYTYFYNLTGVSTTNNNIDSVNITNNSVTNNVNTQHLRIYIHPGS